MFHMLLNIFSIFSDFNIISVVLRILLAVLLGGLIGSERGRHGRAAGLRTHILVCVGATMTSLTSLYISEILGYSGDIARISAQVISGIGFLGAGTIMVRNSSVVTGLTTAAGMWTTAAIGISTGYGFYLGAIIATFVVIFSITVLSRLEASRKNIVSVYAELSDVNSVNKIFEIIKNDNTSSYDIIPPKSGIADNVGIIFTAHNFEEYEKIKCKLELIDSVVIVINDLNM